MDLGQSGLRELETFAKVIIFSAIGLMIFTALSALLNKAAMGGNGDFAVFNLKRRRAWSARQLQLLHDNLHVRLTLHLKLACSCV